MPVYTLALSGSFTQRINKYFPISIDGQQNLLYSVDFDSLFKGANYSKQYTKCRVRLKIVSGDTHSQGITWTNNVCYVSLNLPSTHNLYTPTNGTPICLINQIQTPTTNTNNVIYNSSLNNINGVHLDEIPKGSQLLNILMIRKNHLGTIRLTRTMHDPFFLISFELL